MTDSAPLIKKLGRYDIIRVLGKGAMGVVYEAQDPNLNRKVAIKTVRVDSLSKDEALEYELRFRTEAYSAARLQHPNIVSVYDSDREGDTPFLVMEYVKGNDLKHHLDRGQRYPLEQSVHMVRDLLSALDYAHQRKIIHRDIKPANLLLQGDGRVKLTDFGVARIQDSGEATRTQGGVVGTLKYMAPEQVAGQSADASSDLFAAGVVLYQLLTDRRPFDGDSYFAIVNQISNQDPPPPSSINRMLPFELDAVLAKALAKDKAKRYATANEFSLALQSAANRADPTIVPSANPFKTVERQGTDAYQRSASSGTASGLSGSAITQELELVYWKDIKDSDDAHDLEGFLARFPEGVYGDLAKRRLKRLADAQAAQGHALYESTAVVPAKPQQADATDLLIGEPTVPLAKLAPIAPPAPVATAATAAPAPYEPTPDAAAKPKAPARPQALPKPVAPAKPDAPEKITRTQAPGAGAATVPPRRATAWLVGAGALAAVSLAAWAWLGGASSGAANPSTAASITSISTPAATTTSSAATSAAALQATNKAPAPPDSKPYTPALIAASAIAAAPAASSAVATPASLKASAAAAKAKAQKLAASGAVSSPATVAAPATAMAPAHRQAAGTPSISAPHQGTEQPRPTASASPAKPLPTVAAHSSAAQGPKEACEGKILFSYGACLIEQCARPVFHNHPVCVERREQDERRRTHEQNR